MYTYYGQTNEDHLRHGIGTVLYDNGFCYQGMLEEDQITGIGVSLDPNMFKYVGQHLNGER
jgi:hypothetical protein